MSHFDSINVRKQKADSSEGNEHTLQESIKSSPKTELVDIHGMSVKEDTDYFLEIYDRPDEILKIECDEEYYVALYATYRLNRAKKLVVRYTLIDGIHYLTRHEYFLQADEHRNEVEFKEEKPEKQNILELHATENNSFKIARPNDNICLTWDKRSICCTNMRFIANDDVAADQKPVEFTLRRDSIDDPIHVLVPDGFDMGSIDKCLMDYDSKIISYVNEDAINSRLGSNFIVLHEDYFVAYAGKNYVKCDYNCRNRIMKELCPSKGDDYYAEWIKNDCHLERIDGIVHNITAPYILFTDSCVRDEIANNTIILGNFIQDPQKMADIIQSRSYNYCFFSTYFHECYSFWLTGTLENFGFELPQDDGHFFVERLCSSDFNGSFTQLISDFRVFEEKQWPNPSIRIPEFQLKDIEGQIVEKDTDYNLVLYDQDLDVLMLYGFHQDDNVTISAASCQSRKDSIIVQLCVVDEIYYLRTNNKYLYLMNSELGREIGLTDQVPTKDQRLQFLLTKYNTFKIVSWSQCNYLRWELFDHNYSALSFDVNGPPVELFLKRVSSR